MSLYLGIGCAFVFLLDSDAKGREAKMRYLKELPITNNAVLEIGEVFAGRKKSIEDLVSTNMKNTIGEKYGVKRVTKKHILRAFSEALSGRNDLPNDRETLANLKVLVDSLKKRFGEY